MHSPLREALHRELVYELRMKQRRLCDRDFTGYSFDTDEYGNHCHMAYWMIAPASEPVPSSELHVAAVHFAAGIPLDAAQRSRRKRRPPKVPLGHTPEAAA